MLRTIACTTAWNCAIVWICCSLLNHHAVAQSTELKTLNGHFPFKVPDTAEAWHKRSKDLKRRVLVATGLWPMPEKPPIESVLHGKITRDGFTVEKVYFQSLPGHYVTGMLFRPSADNQNGVINGKRPGVLSPHGHGGRTMRLDDKALAKQIESGGEVFKNSGRYPKLARCAHLARMGCITFIFDMLGYADSQQIDYTTAHRHAKPRPEESDRSQPCLYSIDADLNLQTVMGIQTWNAIRSLDFLAQLPDVDADRLGVTGGSGGGTQTILLGAIDSRIKVGFPNGMVSTSMQGGCYCENCNYLRIGTGNVELAALFAPKPQGMTAANDWTKDMLNDGYPELKQLYTMLEAEDNVMCGDVLQFPHNYNYVTRSMMYPWMAKHLGLPPGTPLQEQDFQPLMESDLQVWTDQHPTPQEVGVEHERNLLAWWKEQSDKKLKATIPSHNDSPSQQRQRLTEFRNLVGGAWNVIFDRELPSSDEVTLETLPSETQTNLKRYRISHPQWGTSVDALVSGNLDSKNLVISQFIAQVPGSDHRDTNFHVIPESVAVPKNSLVVVPLIRRQADSQEIVANNKEYSAYTFGYNRPEIVQEFQQILCVLAAFNRNADGQTILIANGKHVPAALAVGMVAGESVDQLIVQSAGERLADVSDYRDAQFLPGAGKYFDLPGLMALRAPEKLSILGENPSDLDLVKRIYAAAGSPENLSIR